MKWFPILNHDGYQKCSLAAKTWNLLCEALWGSFNNRQQHQKSSINSSLCSFPGESNKYERCDWYQHLLPTWGLGSYCCSSEKACTEICVLSGTVHSYDAHSWNEKKRLKIHVNCCLTSDLLDISSQMKWEELHLSLSKRQHLGFLKKALNLAMNLVHSRFS